jgi:DeoR/GlpR family transcriptional regulator of sugar metabolism
LGARRATQLTGAAEATIRRDFAALARDGLVERRRGSIALPAGQRMTPLAFREVRFPEEKARLARHAVARLRADQVLFVDGGSTTSFLAACLPDLPLRIITNSVRLAEALDRRPRRRQRQDVYLTGGLLYPQAGLLVGPGVLQGVRQYHADWAFISVGGITADGLFNTNDRVVDAEREMIRHADRTVVLADHSKIGRFAMCHVCDLAEIDVLITDADPAKSTVLPRIAKAGVTVERAGPD